MKKFNTKRYMRKDSYNGDITDPLSLNLYAYCQGNPIMYTDPTGHSATQAAKIIIKTPAGKVIVVAAAVTYGIAGTYNAVQQADVTINGSKYIDGVSPAPSRKKDSLSGEPGSVETKWKGDTGKKKQDRVRGDDGYPDIDIDHDHDHGQGMPHTHEWDRPEDGSSPTNENRGPGRPTTQEDLDRVNNEKSSTSSGGTSSTLGNSIGNALKSIGNAIKNYFTGGENK